MDSSNSPKSWDFRFVSLNASLGDVTKKFLKDDLQLIACLLNFVPKDLYGPLITTYQVQGFDNTTLFKVQFILREYWSSNVRHKGSK